MHSRHVFEYMGLPRPGNCYSWRGVTTVAVKSSACAARPWNSAVVEVTLARLGKGAAGYEILALPFRR
jgi:hypothetical protein